MRSRSYARKMQAPFVATQIQTKSLNTKLKGVAFLPNKNTTCLEMILNLCSKDSLSQYKNFINSLFRVMQLLIVRKQKGGSAPQSEAEPPSTLLLYNIFYPNFYWQLLYHPPLPLAMVPPPFC